MTWPGIKPWSFGPLANTLPTRPMSHKPLLYIYIYICPQGHIAQSIKGLVRSSDIPKRVWVQYPMKAVENFQRGNLQEITDNWHPLNMARGTRTVYPTEQNKGLSSTFQPPEEGRRVQRPKPCDKHGDKDEDNSLKNVNEIYIYIYILMNISNRGT